MTIKELGNFLIQITTECNFQDIATHLSDKAVSNTLGENPLGELDLVSIITQTFKHFSSLKEKSLQEKVFRFIHQLEDVTEEEKLNFKVKMETNPSYNHKIGEVVVLALDNADRLEKADLIGIIFRNLIIGKINQRVALRLISIVNRSYLEDLATLVNFRDRDNIINNGEIVEEFSIEHLFILGLLYNGGFDGGGADGGGGIRYILTEAGQIMIDVVFKDAGMEDILKEVNLS